MVNHGETPPAVGDSDEDLMKQVSRGSRPAFDELMQRYQQPLLNFFQRMGVIHDAEDMVQDSFIKLYQSRKRYKPTASFKTFLYTIARRVSIDRHRKKARRPEVEYDDALETPHDFSRSPAGVAADRIDVAEALLKLPETMRSVVILSVMEGLTMNETGEVLGIPEGTVKSRLFHALKRLREAIKDAPQDGLE